MSVRNISNFKVDWKEFNLILSIKTDFFDWKYILFTVALGPFHYEYEFTWGHE